MIEHLQELGIRLSMTDNGTTVYLVDTGVPTLGEQIIATAREPHPSD